MSTPHQAQLRLIYSLLKPVVRIAARFHVPLRTVNELLRLAYFESLRSQGLPQREVAERLGQTERNIRSYARRLKEDFFAAENEIGAVRMIENAIASHEPTREQLRKLLPALTSDELGQAVRTLLDERRVEETGGKLKATSKYSLLSSEKFHHRIDALNHFLDGVQGAVMSRLVFNNEDDAMIKTITFSALPRELKQYLVKFEGDLRRNIARLEEQLNFDGTPGERYTFAVAVAPLDVDAAHRNKRAPRNNQ